MKKFLLAALAVLCLTPSAYAGGVVNTETVNWVWQTNLGLNGVTDKKCLIGSANDTTSFVGTKGWYVPDYPLSTDSLVVARFIISVDSSGAYSPGATTTTVTVQGAGSNGNNVIVLGTYTLKPTTGQTFISVPLRISTGKAANLESLGNWAHLPPLIRLVVQNGGSMNAARCFIQYLKPTN